jgi:hypothetical protein
VREDVLAVGGAEAQAPEHLGQLGIEALDVGLEDRLLPQLHDVGLELGLRLVVGLLDAGRVDAPVLQELLEGHAGDLPAHAVEGAEDDGVGRVVDDEVDAGEVLEGADVAALAADDAALHVVARELDDGDGRLGGVARRETLHRHGEDRADAALGVALGLLLDGAQDLDRLVAGLVLDLLEERLLGLARADPRDALEGALALLAQVGELLLLGREALDVGLEVALARVELGRAAVERALQRLRPLGGAFLGGHAGGRFAPPGVDGRRRLGVTPVRRGESSASIEGGGRDEADCQDGRRDHEFHCRVLSPRAGMAPSPDGLPWS